MKHRHARKIETTVVDHVPRTITWHVIECRCGWSSAAPVESRRRPRIRPAPQTRTAEGMSAGRVVTSRAQGTDEQLVAVAQAGDARAMAELVARYEHTAQVLAFPYRTHLSDYDDMCQEALIAVTNAVRTWRPDGGASFRSLAGLAIRRALYTTMTTDNRMGRRASQVPLSLNAELETHGFDGEVTLENAVADPFATDPAVAVARSADLRTFVETVRHDLSDVEREALVGFLNGMSQLEIEDSLQTVTGRISGATWPDGRRRTKMTENALQRARQKLRSRLEEPRPLGAAA